MFKKILTKIGIVTEENTSLVVHPIEVGQPIILPAGQEAQTLIKQEIRKEIEEKAVIIEPKKNLITIVEEPKSEQSTIPDSCPPVVEFKSVYKSFGKKNVLNDVSFCVDDIPNKGELIAIIGQSGCGKSTILRMIAGLEPHYPQTSGEVLVFGKPLREASADADRGVVDQSYSLFPHLTVLKNVAFGLKLQGVSRKERYALAREWINKVGLCGNEDKYTNQLSGGMKQRVAIASTLILKPKIILMDEPFGALDPKIRRSAWKLLVDLWNEQNSTVFIVTHSMEEAYYLGDRVFRMGTNPGRLVEIVQAPRPNIPAEEMRKQPWFAAAVQELQRRLETDAPPSGELPAPK